MTAARRFHGWPGVASIALAVTLIAAPAIAGVTGVDVAPDVAVKAALLFNFAKFVEWPALPAGAAIVVCFVGSDGIAAAFVETVRGQNIAGHRLDASVLRDSANWRACHMLFIADAETRASAGYWLNQPRPGSDGQRRWASLGEVSSSSTSKEDDAPRST